MSTGDAFRPLGWNDFLGQEKLKAGLQIRIDAAKRDGRPLGHILLCSPPGAGKTSLAHVIAVQAEEDLESITMPVAPKVLQSLVTQHTGMLLIDECHRASPRLQEDLLTVLQDGYWQGSSGRRVYNDWLTVIAATTEPQLVIAPLYQRFEHVPSWAEYTDDDMVRIVLSMAQKVGVVMSVDSAMALGRASAGIPRRARQFVLAYRDLATDVPVSVDDVLDLCETAEDGLSVQHEHYLEVIEAVGGTAGLRTLCSLLRLNESVVTQLERVLILRGFLTLEERGRTLTRPGYARIRQMKKVA